MHPLNAKLLERSNTLCDYSFEEDFMPKCAVARRCEPPVLCNNLNIAGNLTNRTFSKNPTSLHGQSRLLSAQCSDMLDSKARDSSYSSSEAEELDTRIYFTAKTRVISLHSTSASRTSLASEVADANTAQPALESALSTTTLVATTPPVQDNAQSPGLLDSDTADLADDTSDTLPKLRHIRRTCNVRDWFRRNGVSEREFEWATAAYGRFAVTVAHVVVCFAAAVGLREAVTPANAPAVGKEGGSVRGSPRSQADRRLPDSA
ncbi:hypothetical protein HDU84_000590 [Entophlyctis sp. JEL0112]|nr:hypothetical protein HDU84_000590 [Entophlyctis sp. JEL0112]